MLSDRIDQADSVRQFFDEDSVRYIQKRYQHACSNIDEYSYVKRKDLVLNLMGKGNGRVLDVGCGPAVYTPELLERGFEVWDVDLSPKMIEQAKERVWGHPFSSKAHFLVSDLLSLRFQDNFFNYLLCIGVLSYVSDIRKAFQQIGRLLRPGGLAILQASNPFSPFEILEVRLGRPVRRWMKKFSIGRDSQSNHFKMTPYSVFTLTKLCKRVGLESISVQYYDFRLPFGSKFFPKTILKISQRMEAFERSPLLGLLGACYLMSVKKPLGTFQSSKVPLYLL